MNRRMTTCRLMLSMLFLVFALTIGRPVVASALEGDFDGDGRLGVGDAVAAIQAIAGRPVAAPLQFTNTVGMTFVTVPAGAFTMGSPDAEPGRQPDESRRSVSITTAFYLQATEVTQGQWRAVMGTAPARFTECGDDCPVESVSWAEAKNFINRLNALERTAAYRLPTEAEWEYAARAGTATATSAGELTQLECGPDPVLAIIGWYCGNAGERPHPVGRRAPNPWGLYDMHGNVWEWTADGYRADLAPGPVSDPMEEETSGGRVYRGGGWSGDARTCRSADRDAAVPGARAGDLGFRVARTR